MQRSSLSLLVLAAFALLAVPVSAAEAPRPNVIYILADDLGYTDVGWNGDEIKTPNLDKLAAGGARLDAFYAQPVCSPTRAALMTGRYPIRHGLQVGVVRPWAQYGLPLEERTLANALKEAGYQTAIAGKWHLGHFRPEYLPTRRGFDHQYGHYNGALDYNSHDRDGGHDWHRNDKANYDEGYSTTLIGDEAVKRIKERDPSKPFFLYLPFNAVHTPLQVPDSYLEQYASLKPKKRQQYAAMMTCLDEQVGKVVAALKEGNQLDNTLIFFSSDNGGPLSSGATNGTLRAGKGSLYEGGVRVCAFANWPGKIKAGSVVTEPLHIVDIYPTVVKLAGGSLEQQTKLDGHDAWATIADGKPSPHTEILLNATPDAGAIRVGDWKLVVGGNDDVPEDRRPNLPRRNRKKVNGMELFNLKEDRSEENNLAEQNPEKLAELLDRYKALASQQVPPKIAPKADSFVTPKVWGEAE